MKKFIITVCVTLIIILLVWVVVTRVTTRITFNSNDFYTISINGFGSIGLNTEDKTKIHKIIGYLNSISYYKVSEREIHNESPDTSILTSDKEGKIVDQIAFYGNLVEYKGNQYRAIPFMHYSRLEKLCNKLNSK